MTPAFRLAAVAGGAAAAATASACPIGWLELGDLCLVQSRAEPFTECFLQKSRSLLPNTGQPAFNASFPGLCFLSQRSGVLLRCARRSDRLVDAATPVGAETRCPLRSAAHADAQLAELRFVRTNTKPINLSAAKLCETFRRRLVRLSPQTGCRAEEQVESVQRARDGAPLFAVCKLRVRYPPLPYCAEHYALDTRRGAAFGQKTVLEHYCRFARAFKGRLWCPPGYELRDPFAQYDFGAIVDAADETRARSRAAAPTCLRWVAVPAADCAGGKCANEMLRQLEHELGRFQVTFFLRDAKKAIFESFPHFDDTKWARTPSKFLA